MRILHTTLTAVLGLALIGLFSLSWKTQRELNALKQTQHQITDANEDLKKTLGELTIAITQKEKEIDKLHESSCISPEKRNSLPHAQPRQADRAEASNPGGIGAN